MKTITAKELRDNLDDIVRRVRAGERIQVTYRSRPAFTLVQEAAATPSITPGTPAATGEFLKRAAKLRQTASTPGVLPQGGDYKAAYYGDMAQKYNVDKPEC